MKAAVVQHFGRPLVIEDRHLNEVNEAIDEVRQSRAMARLVLRP